MTTAASPNATVVASFADQTSASRYTPPTTFKPFAFEEVESFVAARALVTIVAIAPIGLINTHAPVRLARDADGRPLLEGHVARTNATFMALTGSVTALALFQKEQEYGLPEAARETDSQSPFGAVHLHGRLEIVDDHAFQRGNIDALADHHIAARIHPWNAPDLPSAFKDVLADKTLGFRFHIERAEACHAYVQRGKGRTDGIVEIDPREFTSPNCRPRT
jgi:transcriptional regulator